MSTEPHPRPATDAECDAAFELIVRAQADPSRAVAYVGTTRDGIMAELADLEPGWVDTLQVVVDASGVVGAATVDWDADLGPSWIHGPWVEPGLDYCAVGGSLVRAIADSCPASVTRHELCADVANTSMATLARRLGWEAGVVNHVLVADPEIASHWPAPDPRVRHARRADASSIEPLHTAEFPDTYYDTAKLVDGAECGTLLVDVLEDDGSVCGYAAGRVQPDGSGYLDYFAVAESARGRGVGAALLASIGRRILDASPQHDLHLTVQDPRAAARSLYSRFGFRSDGSIVAYTSP